MSDIDASATVNLNALHVGQYLSLDTDHNGMLNKMELSR